jgi:hypothetical protein
MSFVTVVDTGINSTATAGGVQCSFAKLRSSIVWTPDSTAPPISGCQPESTIAGPTTVTNTMNVDPMFVSRATHDYHLGSNSPARDAVGTGPATDFEGDPRPQGMAFDLGADEAP